MLHTTNRASTLLDVYGAFVASQAAQHTPTQPDWDAVVVAHRIEAAAALFLELGPRASEPGANDEPSAVTAPARCGARRSMVQVWLPAVTVPLACGGDFAGATQLV